ncbi:Gfo/Idh/MocA family oxidoreductase [Variovorax sp. LT1R16]|uniref:Gfo/Idh/MocA family oxidoreductase n=1 Tax=Variovorax sp. LT1R16 TaxID=3443728 RepID=UPI003F4736BB
MTLQLCLAGEGAIARSHMEVLKETPGVVVVCLVGGVAGPAASFAQEWSIPHLDMDLDGCLANPGIDAVVLATPSHLHADQAVACLSAGKHVLIEIPMALNLADSERVAAAAAARPDLVCMVAHTRRFNAPHREMRRRIAEGHFQLQHLVSETYFFRRENTNARGEPRSWVDSLLWHHACHSVDLMSWLLDDPELDAWGQQGPVHPTLGIAMDMTIALRSRRSGGALGTLALSFNNRGPFGGFYRYIGEEGTYRAYRDELLDDEGKSIGLTGIGIESQDREFIAAIAEHRLPEASVAACLPSMRLLDRIERCMAEQLTPAPDGLS